MKATEKQFKYFKYAMGDFDEIFTDWFPEIENRFIRSSDSKRRFIDILGKAFMNGKLTIDVASQIIGAHKKEDYQTIRDIIDSL